MIPTGFEHLPRRTVTREQFVAAAEAAGHPDPEGAASGTQALGGYSVVGDELLLIPREPQPQEPEA